MCPPGGTDSVQEPSASVFGVCLSDNDDEQDNDEEQDTSDDGDRVIENVVEYDHNRINSTEVLPGPLPVY